MSENWGWWGFECGRALRLGLMRYVRASHPTRAAIALPSGSSITPFPVQEYLSTQTQNVF